MTRRRCSGDDRAASPTIGVVLMVGMAVLLVTAVGVYAFGVAGVLEEPGPQAKFVFQYDGSRLTISHYNGDPIPADQVRVTASDPFMFVAADGAYDGSSNASKTFAEMGVEGSVTGGDSVTIGTPGGDLNDYAVRVIWVSADGEQSALLREWTGPAA